VPWARQPPVAAQIEPMKRHPGPGNKDQHLVWLAARPPVADASLESESKGDQQCSQLAINSGFRKAPRHIDSLGAA
jgi:hypothetical protein